MSEKISAQPTDRTDVASVRRSWPWRLVWIFGSILTALTGLAIVVAVWLGSEQGLAFLLDRAQRAAADAGGRFETAGAKGGLYRGVTFERLEWSDGKTELVATKIAAGWSLRSLLRRELVVPAVTVDELTLSLPPVTERSAGSDGTLETSTQMPGYLGLPVSFVLDRFVLKRLLIIPPRKKGAVNQAEPIVVTDVRLRLNYQDGAYNLVGLSAQTPWGKLADTRVSVNDSAPHAVLLRAQFTGAIDAHATVVKAAALGNLNGLNASLQGEFSQSPLSLNVRLKPLSLNPVVSISGWLRKFDLARIEPGLPHTLIDLDLNLLNPRALPQVEQKTGDNDAATGAATLGATKASRPAPPGTEIDEGSAPPATDSSAVRAALPQSSGGLQSAVSARQQTAFASWQGRVEISNAKSGPLSKNLLPIRTASAELLVEPDEDAIPSRLTLQKLRLGIPGVKEEGTVSGTVQISLTETLQVMGMELPVVIAGLQIRNLDAAQFASKLTPTTLSGSVDLSRSYFAVDLSQSEGPLRQAISLPGGGRTSLAAKGRLSDAALHLDSALIQLNLSRISVSGRTTLQAPYQVAVGGQVSEFDIKTWLPNTSGVPAQWRNGLLSGDWTLNGTVAPQFDANVSLVLKDSRLGGHPLAGSLVGALRLQENWQPERLANARLRLRLGSNAISVNGDLGRTGDSLRVTGRLAAPELFDARLRGSLGFKGDLSGPFDSLQARLAVDGRKVSWQQGDQRIAIARFDGKINMPVVTSIVPKTPVELSAAINDFSMGDIQLTSADLSVDGTVQAHQFSVNGRGQGQAIDLSGTAKLNTPVGGEPSWQAKIARFKTRGVLAATLRDSAEVVVTPGAAKISSLGLQIGDGSTMIDELLVDWSGKPVIQARGQFDALPIARLARSAGIGNLPIEMNGLRLSSKFDLRGSNALDLDGSVQLQLREQNVAGEKPIGLAGRNDALIKFTRGQMQGEVDMSLPSLVFSRRFTGSDWEIDGRVAFAGNLSGTLQRPQWLGRLTARELSLLQPALGWRFTNGTLIARFEGRRIILDKLRMDSGAGNITLTGSADLLDEAGPEQLRNNPIGLDGRFELVADHTVVPLGPGQRLVLSGKSELVSDRKGLRWRGALSADEGFIEIAGSGAPGLPDDVLIIDESFATKTTVADEATSQAADEQVTAQAVDPRSPQVETDLDIDLGKKLRVTGGGVNAVLTGRLKLQGSLPGAPRVVGTVNIENGFYRAYEQELKIERGAVRFVGAIDNPVLDITAMRQNLPLKVGVNLGGTALTPRLELISTPALSDAEKLSWLVLGSSLDNAQAGAQTFALKQAAAALIGSDDGSISGGNFADKLGLDTLGLGYASEVGQQAAIDNRTPTGLPGATGNNGLGAREEVVNVGKKLSKRLSVSYEKGVRGLWNLLRIQYEISNRLSVRAQTGSENAIDLMYFYSFD